MKWDAATSGERLFLFIREDVLPQLPESPNVWTHIQDVLSALGGSPDFHAYFRGAVAIQAMRRLLRHCAEATDGAAESTHVKLVSKFASEEVFPALDKDPLGRLSRLVLGASKVSGRAITSATRKDTLQRLRQIRCYLCGLELDPNSTDQQDPARLTLDHLWPSSIGGESTEENLLPACGICQIRKADSPSWEWLNIHNLVWPSIPDDELRQRLQGSTRIARHFHHATALASARRCTLKAAFAILGKMIFPGIFERTGQPTTFFDLRTEEI
jgi:hypothetical protein